MLSTARSQTTTVDTFEFTPFMSPWRRTSCPVTPRRDGKTNLKHFLLEQRPLLAIKYPFLTPQQIKRKGRELWSKLSSKDKKTNLAAPLMRLPTPPKGRVYEEMGKHHFPFRFPGDESLSMFSSPLAKSRRKSLPSFPIASVGHQGTNVRMQSFRKANRITNRNDDMLQVRRPAQEKTYADGCRWPCKAPPVIEHADCKQFGILKRSRKTRKTAGDRRVSFAEANCNTPDDLHSDDCSNSNHDNDLQTNGQNVESSPGHRRERLITLNSNAVNGRIPLSENLKRPTEMSGRKINGHSSADRKKKQPGWSKINAALEIEDGGHSDSDDERDFQLACLHGNTKPVLPHGGYVENCNKGELRQRSCKEGLVSGKTGRHRNRQSKTRNMEKEIHFGAGDQQMGQRKTTHQRKMMNYQKAWQDDKKAPSHANRRQHVDYMDIMTVYDVFDDDDDELIDLSQTRFSDYCDNMKHVAEPCRRKTIACVESERVTFMKENEAMMYDQCTSKVDDQIARKCEKFHRCQPGNTTTQRQAKKGRNGSPMCDSVIRSASSPSCYNLRSQKVEQASRGRNEDRKCVRGRIMPHRDECQHGRSGKLGVGCRNTRKNKVAVAPSGVSVQNQELMTPETTEEVIEATLTNIIRAPRKRRATDSDVPGGENMKSQVEVIKGNSIIGKTLMGDGNSRMDRVRKRLVASSNACEQGYLTKKQKMGNGDIDLCRIPTRAANKDGTGTRVSVPRQRPCTRSCLRALSSLSLYDVESGTQMTWQSAVPNCHAEEHDGMSYCRSATRNRVEDQVGGVSSERGNDKGLLKNYDGLKATQRHKARNDLEGENLHLGIVSSETARPRGTRKSQLLPNQNLTNQIPSIPTCMLSSPSSQQSDTPSSQNQDESRSNATSPFPYISPLPPSKTSSGVGASFLSFLTSKHLQSDLDNVTSSSEDEIPTTLGVVRNDVLTRAVRSMQQLTVPPGVAYSPRRITVSSPSVSGISELSELSSFSGAKPSPAPVELGKSLPGPTFNGKSSHRELGPATIPRDEARLGASPMRWRAGRKTKTEAQRVELSKKEPPRVLEPARVKSQQPVEPPRVKHRTCSSLCDLFDDVKPGNKPLYNRRVVASLPAETSGSFTEMFSPGKGDIFL